MWSVNVLGPSGCVKPLRSSPRMFACPARLANAIDCSKPPKLIRLSPVRMANTPTWDTTQSPPPTVRNLHGLPTTGLSMKVAPAAFVTDGNCGVECEHLARGRALAAGGTTVGAIRQ